MIQLYLQKRTHLVICDKFDFTILDEISILDAHFNQFEADDPTPSSNCWVGIGAWGDSDDQNQDG